MKEIKISKLFHLLYATLLLAPVFAVGVACAQTAFTGNGVTAQANKVNETVGEIPVSDMKVDEWYFLDIGGTNSSYQVGSLYFYDTDVLILEALDTLPNFYSNVSTINFIGVSSFVNINFESYNPFVTGSTNIGNLSIIAFRFKSCEVGEVGNSSLTFKVPSPSESSLLPVFVEEEGYQDIFYTSVDKASQSPFFNWAEKSFLGEGFRYMGNIFGMPTDNPFYTFTCYWCAISILWLIFDVVMYVPKLAHRWLDKGAIE